ncbi:TPA: hypothetical protein HNV44_18495 [Escherichia coli]|nr:hypothetical protein [Escherichia coli]
MTKFTIKQLTDQAREEVDFWRERDELIPSQQTAIRLRLAEIALAALTAPQQVETDSGIYAELYRLRSEVKGPDGFETWRDAAVAEKVRRLSLERDALRYRFLRDKDFFGDEKEPGLASWDDLAEMSYSDFDAAVDARIAHPDNDFVTMDEACRAAMLQGNHRDLSYPVDPQIASYEKIMEQAIPDGYALVPIIPTEDMIINGFEAELREEFRDPEALETYEKMSGCELAAHRTKLCWAAMIAAAPQQERKI